MLRGLVDDDDDGHRLVHGLVNFWDDDITILLIYSLVRTDMVNESRPRPTDSAFLML